jgi:NADH-quinone oxidoreductase subunit N
VAIHQTNVKRFLAWSSVAQAGYILVGLAPGGPLADASVAYYLLVYLVTTIAAFGVAAVVAGATGRERMSEYVGLSETNPRLALVMMLALFSLAGIPPLAGFLGKFYLFAAAAKGGLVWLVLVAAVNSTVSLYYYLILIKWMYIVKPAEGEERIPAIAVPPAAAVVLAVATVGMILVGMVPHVVRWAEEAAKAGF